MTIDEREDLADLLTHPGLQPLLAVLEAESQSVQSEVLKLNMEAEGAERKLLLLKYRAEGAGKLVEAFKRRINTLRAKKT
jgi:hypothetical protein